MNTMVQVEIDGDIGKVWNLVTDIENSPGIINGIDAVEILNKPDNGLVGLKWKETRTLFGKTATEIMWITDAVEQSNYAVRAESHGSVYLTDFRLEGRDGRVLLSTSFRSEAQSFMARLFNALLGRMMSKATAKALLEDLHDIRKAIEG